MYQHKTPHVFYQISFSMGQESRSGLVGASDPEGVGCTEKWSFSELCCWQCAVVHRLLEEEVKFFSGCWPVMMLSSLMWELYNMAAYSIKASLGKSSVKVSRKDIIPPLPDSVAEKHMCKQSHRNMTSRKWGSGRAILRYYILQSLFMF